MVDSERLLAIAEQLDRHGRCCRDDRGWLGAGERLQRLRRPGERLMWPLRKALIVMVLFDIAAWAALLRAAGLL